MDYLVVLPQTRLGNVQKAWLEIPHSFTLTNTGMPSPEVVSHLIAVAPPPSPPSADLKVIHLHVVWSWHDTYYVSLRWQGWNICTQKRRSTYRHLLILPMVGCYKYFILGSLIPFFHLSKPPLKPPKIKLLCECECVNSIDSAVDLGLYHLGSALI